MKNYKKLITIICLGLMVSSSPTQGNAATYMTDTGGAAYEDAYQACCIAPAVVFAVALLAAIIIVGVHNRHGHSHSE